MGDTAFHGQEGCARPCLAKPYGAIGSKDIRKYEISATDEEQSELAGGKFLKSLAVSQRLSALRQSSKQRRASAKTMPLEKTLGRP